MWDREEHIIGEVIGEGKQQLILAIGGMHGNERGGIQAIELANLLCPALLVEL